MQEDKSREADLTTAYRWIPVTKEQKQEYLRSLQADGVFTRWSRDQIDSVYTPEKLDALMEKIAESRREDAMGFLPTYETPPVELTYRAVSDELIAKDVGGRIRKRSANAPVPRLKRRNREDESNEN